MVGCEKFYEDKEMFESSKDSKTNEVLYLIATILFIISIIINFTGGNMVVGAASLMGFTGVGRTYLRIRKKNHASEEA